MELGITERIRLLEILPDRGDIGTLKIVRNLRESLSFTEEDIQDMEIKMEPGDKGSFMYKWNQSKEKPLIIDFKPMSLRIITDALKKADQQGSLTEQHISIYEKFFGEKKIEE